MAERNLRTRIQKGVFVLDGAMGTQLIARGVEPGRCNDWLNVELPNMVLDVHKAYIDAGSDAILTNTFGANRYALGRHGCADKALRDQQGRGPGRPQGGGRGPLRPRRHRSDRRFPRTARHCSSPIKSAKPSSSRSRACGKAASTD